MKVLAHLVYQPKSLLQSCIVHRHWHRHLCTPPCATELDIETLYLVSYTLPIYAHQIFRNFDW